MQSLVRKISSLLGITSAGQATMANSLPVVLASDQTVPVSNLLGITSKGQATIENSLPVVLASDQEITSRSRRVSFSALRGLTFEEDCIASENGSGQESTYLPVFATRGDNFALLDRMKDAADIQAYFKGNDAAFSASPMYFLIPFGENNYSKFSLFWDSTLDTTLTVAVYGLVGDGRIWSDRMLRLSPVTAYAKEISASITSRLAFVSDGAYPWLMLVITPAASPTSGYWTLVVSAQA